MADSVYARQMSRYVLGGMSQDIIRKIKRQDTENAFLGQLSLQIEQGKALGFVKTSVVAIEMGLGTMTTIQDKIIEGVGKLPLESYHQQTIMYAVLEFGACEFLKRICLDDVNLSLVYIYDKEPGYSRHLHDLRSVHSDEALKKLAMTMNTSFKDIMSRFFQDCGDENLKDVAFVKMLRELSQLPAKLCASELLGFMKVGDIVPEMFENKFDLMRTRDERSSRLGLPLLTVPIIRVDPEELKNFVVDQLKLIEVESAQANMFDLGVIEPVRRTRMLPSEPSTASLVEKYPEHVGERVEMQVAGKPEIRGVSKSLKGRQQVPDFQQQTEQPSHMRSQQPGVRGLIGRYERLTPEQTSAKTPEPSRGVWQRTPGQVQWEKHSPKQQSQQEAQAGSDAMQGIQRKREELARLQNVRMPKRKDLARASMRSRVKSSNLGLSFTPSR